MDDERAVDELEGLANIVIRNKHPDSPSGELSHQLADIADRNRINPGERLVEEHEFGIGGEGAGDFHAPTLAARKHNSRRIPEMGNGKLIKQPTQLTLAHASVPFIQLEDGANVVLNRKPPEDRRLLGQIPDTEPRPLIHGQAGDVRPIERDGALIGGQSPVIM